MNKFLAVLTVTGLMILFAGGSLASSGWDQVDNSRDTLSGHVALKYKFRHDSYDSKTYHRLFQSMDLCWEPLSTNNLGFVFSGDVSENLSRHDVGDSSIWNTYGDVYGLIYESYAQISPLSSVNVILGRHSISHQMSVRIDGASSEVRFSDNRGRFYLFAGYGADPFGDSSWDSSKQAGCGVDYLFREKTRVGVEYLTTREEDFSGDGETYQQAALSLAHDFEDTQAGISVSVFDSEVESLRVHTSFLKAMGDDSEISLSYGHQFIEIENMPASSSPFIRLIGPIKPYQEFMLYLTKLFPQNRVCLTGGLDVRHLLEDEKEYEYNHSYVHAYLAYEKSGLFNRDIRLTIQTDVWETMNTSIDDKTVVAGGGDLAFGISEKTTWSMGSFYSLYTYDYYADINEKTDVYSVFVTVAHTLKKDVKIKAEYDLDIYDQYEHRVVVTTDWQF